MRDTIEALDLWTTNSHDTMRPMQNGPKLGRFGRTLKWSGLAFCLLLTLAMVLSCWWTVRGGYGHHRGYLSHGAFKYGLHKQVTNYAIGVRRIDIHRPPPLWFRYHSWLGMLEQDGTRPRSWQFTTPLWVPLAIIALPTTWAWRRDRPFPQGHCHRCGYNLTGNISGKCPECGTQV